MKNTEVTEVVAVSAHERLDWSDEENLEKVEGRPVAVVQTMDNNGWIAVCDMEAEVGEPVTVVQAMKSSKLRRPGRVLAQWDGKKSRGYWPTDVPMRMPLYLKQAS